MALAAAFGVASERILSSPHGSGFGGMIEANQGLGEDFGQNPGQGDPREAGRFCG